MPRHPRALKYTQCITRKLVNFLKVHDTRIIIVLAGEQRLRKVGRMRVRERVRVRVPAPEAEIEPADARTVVVYNDDFLVVGPKFDVIYLRHGLVLGWIRWKRMSPFEPM